MTQSESVPDFEAYARESLHVEAQFVFPRPCRQAMQEARGVFVDIGAGDGAVLRSARDQRLLDGFDRIVAVDVSPTRVARLQELRIPNLNAAVAEASNLDLERASVDLAFSHQVIEHVQDDGEMIAELFRILRAGGRAFVTSVSKRWYGWYFYRCNGKWRLDPTHVREYASLEQFASLFERAGFRIESKVERPLGHRFDKIAFRICERMGLIGRVVSVDVLSKNRYFRWLSNLEIRVPGYSYVEVLVRKP